MRARAEKLDVYAKLLSVPDPSKEPEGSLSKRLNLDPPVLSGMLTQMKTNPLIRADLKKMGYTDEQIPEWVAAGAELPAGGAEIAEGAELPAERAGGSSLQKPKPAGVPVRVARARKKTSTELNPAQVAEPSPAQVSSAPQENRNVYWQRLTSPLARVASTMRRSAVTPSRTGFMITSSRRSTAPNGSAPPHASYEPHWSHQCTVHTFNTRPKIPERN